MAQKLSDEEMRDAESFARMPKKGLLRLIAQAQAGDDAFESPESHTQFRVVTMAAILAKLPQDEVDAAHKEGSNAAKLVRQGMQDDVRIQILDGPEGSEACLRGDARAYISRFDRQYQSRFSADYDAARHLFNAIIEAESDVATRTRWSDAWRAASAILDVPPE
jgi:hypothetical protein